MVCSRQCNLTKSKIANNEIIRITTLIFVTITDVFPFSFDLCFNPRVSTGRPLAHACTSAQHADNQLDSIQNQSPMPSFILNGPHSRQLIDVCEYINVISQVELIV